MTIQPIFENIHETILEKLDVAESSIKISMAWFTDNALFQKLIEKAKQNIRVELILLNDEMNKASYINNSGILNFAKFKLDLNQLHEHAHVTLIERNLEFFLHSKFCVIDAHIVITGSYNWSVNARNNIENIVVIDDNVVGSQFTREFERIKIKKYEVVMARDLPVCKFCPNPAARVRIYDMFNNTSRYYENFKEFHFCLKHPVEHIDMLKDSEDFNFQLGNLVEYESLQLQEEVQANPGLTFSHKQVGDRFDKAIADYFGTSLNLYTDPIGDRIAMLIKRVGDPDEEGECPKFVIEWNHPLAQPFADNFDNDADELMEKLYPLLG